MSWLAVTMKKTIINVAIGLPEDIARQLEAAWHDMPRRVLEAVAVEGYRSEALMREKVGRLVRLDFEQTEALPEGAAGLARLQRG